MSRLTPPFFSLLFLALLSTSNITAQDSPAVGAPKTPTAPSAATEQLVAKTASSSTTESPQALPGEQTLQRSISAGERHRYSFDLEPGAWRVDVEQHGVNVLSELIDESGRSSPFDSPLQYYGTDTRLLELTSAETWQLVVSSPRGTGEYAVRRHLLQGPELEESSLSTLRVLSRAAELYALGTSEDRRQILDLVRPLPSHLDPQRQSFELAEVLDYMGTLERHQGNYEQSSADHRQALAIWEQRGDTSRQARSHNGLGLSLLDLGQVEEARRHFEASLETRRLQGDLAAVVRTLNNVCLIYHSQGLLPKAGSCYRQALKVLVELDLPRNEGLLRLNLGNVYRALAEPELAEDNFSRALRLLRKAGDDSGEAMALNHLAVLARVTGRYGDALGRYFEALDLERRMGRTRHQARILSNIGFAYFSLGDMERAKGFFLQSLPLRRQSQDRRGEAVTLGHLGNIYRLTSEAQLSLEHQRRSLDLYRELGNKRGEATALLYLAESQIAVDQTDEALQSLATALSHLEQVGARDTEAHVLLVRAELLLSQDNPRAALPDVAQSLELSLALRHRVGEISARVLKARTHRQLDDPMAAMTELDEAIQSIERLRTRVSQPDQRAYFLASVRRAFELRIDLEMDLHAIDPEGGHALRALELSERAHARSLLDLVRQSHDQGTTRPDDAVPDDTSVGDALVGDASTRLAKEEESTDAETLRDQYATAQHRLDAKADRQLRLLRASHDVEEAKELELEIASALSELEILEAQLQRSSDNALSVPRLRALDSAAIQSLLEDGTVMLEYSLGEQRSFVWRIEHDEIHVYELPPRSQLEDQIRVVQSTLSRPPSGGSRQAELAAVHGLSKVLLGPLLDSSLTSQDLTGEIGEAPRLVIIPDGALSLLPFAALHLPRHQTPPDADPWNRTEPILERFEITHLPSASVLLALRQTATGRSTPKYQVAVLADPVFDHRDPRWQTGLEDASASLPQEPASIQSAILDTADALSQPIPFERLPATRREAEAILAVASPESSWVAMGFEANRDAVFDPQLGDFRIVHFATHGLVDDRNPALSGLVLSQIDAQGRSQPGFLRLHDIGRLPLNAELVVLSGCQTATGREIRGEGLIGLGRGFMSAGAQQVAASLWRVQDRATAELMTHFYEHLLRHGDTPTAALRAAQRAVRQQRRWRHPYYWAAFVVQGDWRNTSTKSGLSPDEMIDLEATALKGQPTAKRTPGLEE